MSPRVRRTRLPLLTVLAAVVAASSTAAAHAGPHRADGRLGDWTGQPTMLAGRSQVSNGELIYTDYLYDDYGADLDGMPSPTDFRGALAPTSGDYRYPEDEARYGYNAADLRELRVGLGAETLHALIALQTMKARDASIATIAIDADGKQATGGGEWPDGAGLSTAGADHFITVWGGGARITDATGKTHRLRHATNLRRNAFEVDVPRKLLGTLTLRPRIWIAVGLAGPGGTFIEQEGEAAVFDIGFQRTETYGLTSQWGDQRQAAALARAEISPFTKRMPLILMEIGLDKSFRLRPGYYNRIFRSRYSYGEGIELKEGSVGGDAEPMFGGRYQPYGLYIPKRYDRRRKHALLLDGHSLDVNHNEYAAVGTRQLPQLGDARRSIIFMPLARGTDGWYLSAGLIDVFEAWRDVRRHYNVDPSRTSITGYSMGGYMTYRLGLLMPDAFARASVYVGPPRFGVWPYPGPVISEDPYWDVRANTNLIVENGLNLPFEIVHGNADQLVPISGVVHQADTFNALGNPYRFYHHEADDHFSFIVTSNNWLHTRDWLGNARRDLSPFRVRYKRYPSMDLRKAGLVFDGAYWVDRMVVRDRNDVDDFGRIDATTLALGGRMPRLVEEGTSPYAPTRGGVSPALVTGQHYAPGALIRERNAFEAELTNLRSVTFLTRRMGLDPKRRVVAMLEGDGVTTLRFRGRGFGNAIRINLRDGKRHRLVIPPRSNR